MYSISIVTEVSTHGRITTERTEIHEEIHVHETGQEYSNVHHGHSYDIGTERINSHIYIIYLHGEFVGYCYTSFYKHPGL